jgi:hypothetical protein
VPRFFKLRDGCDWLWDDVLQAEDEIEGFAHSIQRQDAPGWTVEKIVADMRVFRYHPDDRLAGQVSRLEHQATGHYWVASREHA